MERRTRSYLQLIKPGITVSNTMTAAAAACLAASQVGFDFANFVGVIIGTALVIASACVINNLIDRDIDKRMKRTSGRELVARTIDARRAIVFAVSIGLAGFISLYILTNGLTLLIGIIAYVWYVVIYGIAKRTTPLSTIIGGVPGALPPVAGYTALVGQLDLTALLLFLILFLWQLPHFYAIAIFRRSDYDQAKLPVWTVRYGIESARRQILMFIMIFVLVSLCLPLVADVGYAYLFVMTAVGAYWAYRAITTYRSADVVRWSRQMFGVSLLTILVTSAAIAAGGYLL